MNDFRKNDWRESLKNKSNLRLFEKISNETLSSSISRIEEILRAKKDDNRLLPICVDIDENKNLRKYFP